jgi:hypothetical protein
VPTHNQDTFNLKVARIPFILLQNLKRWRPYLF